MSGPIKNARCVGCGCTDAQACEGGCHWVDVDRTKGTGLCSRCDLDSRETRPIDTAAARALVKRALTGNVEAVRELGVWTFRHLETALDEIDAARAAKGGAT